MFPAAIAAVSISLIALPALAGPDAEALIAGAATQLSDPVTAPDIIHKTIDVPSVARFTLGKYVRRVSDAEQAKFTAAFEAFLKHTFEDHQAKFTDADIKVIGSTDRNDRDSIVETEVKRRGEPPMTVRWRVVERDGAWGVVDVQVGGLWLAIEQRAQIAAILGRPRATIDDAIAALG